MTPGAAEFMTYGPNAAAEGLAKAQAYNNSFSPLNDPAAYGSAPAPVMPQITGPSATAAAIGAGNQVNSQLPGYAGDLTTVGQNIEADLKGEVSPDVMAELQQTAAEQGISTGGATGAAYLKALGLTSLGLEQTGQQDLQSILSSLPGARIAENPTFYTTTGQDLEARQQNSLWAAAPNPMAAARAGLAATGAGYATGAGSGGVRLPAPLPNPGTSLPPAPVSPLNPFPAIEDVNPPGSPGAYAAWNAWNGTPIYQGGPPVDFNDTGANVPVDDDSLLAA